MKTTTVGKCALCNTTPGTMQTSYLAPRCTGCLKIEARAREPIDLRPSDLADTTVRVGLGWLTNGHWALRWTRLNGAARKAVGRAMAAPGLLQMWAKRCTPDELTSDMVARVITPPAGPVERILPRLDACRVTLWLTDGSAGATFVPYYPQQTAEGREYDYDYGRPTWIDVDYARLLNLSHAWRAIDDPLAAVRDDPD